MDIEHCYVYTYDPKDGSHTKFQLPEHCSTICLTEDPDKLVTTLIKYGPFPSPLWLIAPLDRECKDATGCLELYWTKSDRSGGRRHLSQRLPMPGTESSQRYSLACVCTSLQAETPKPGSLLSTKYSTLHMPPSQGSLKHQLIHDLDSASGLAAC